MRPSKGCGAGCRSLLRPREIPTTRPCGRRCRILGTVIQALSFDLDDTLLDPSANAGAVRRTCEVLAAASPGLAAAAIEAANRVVWPAYFPEVEELWVSGKIETALIGEEGWRRTLAACGCNDEALVRLARERHHQYQIEGCCLFDDVLDCLEGLRPDLKLALITNGASDLQREKLRRLDIERRFDVVVVSGEHGVAKPDRGVFEVVARTLGVPPGSTWHVGDNLRSDVGGAKAAGLTAVWLNRDGVSRRESEPEPDIEIASLAELAGLIA